jgi:dimethylargininase
MFNEIFSYHYPTARNRHGRRHHNLQSRPAGLPESQGKIPSIAAALAPFRDGVWIQPPGTLDGGDVLRVGQCFFIGLSGRTNGNGAGQLGAIVSGWGYTWSTVPFTADLHFKSRVNLLSDDTLLMTQAYAEHPALAGYHRQVFSTREQYAGNCLFVNKHLIILAGFPDTRNRMMALGKPVVELAPANSGKCTAV